MSLPKADSPTLIVAGGGTGGHVLAGVAIADAWKARYPGARVLFVGAQGGIEEKLVPRAGYPLELLKLGSLNRVSMKTRLRTIVRLPLSFLKSLMILRREKPAAVVGVGGYASGPLVLTARFVSGVRTAILEQNAVPGLTNRVLGKFSDRVMSAFPIEAAQFPGKDVKVTGNPVRAQIHPMPKAAFRPFTIFIFGGSQGALGINTMVLEAVPFLKDVLKGIRFIHQTGERDFERVRKGHEELGTQARVEKFIHDMPSAYADASLIVCRAGSSTLAEIAAVGRGSVLVPFPYAADNHQEKNAQIFVDAGAARLLVQFQSSGKDLAVIIREMMEHPDRLAQMEQAVKQFYRPNAAADVVRALME